MRTPTLALLLLFVAPLAACRPPVASVESVVTAQGGFVDPLGVLNEGASAADVAPRAQALATLTRHAPPDEARAWALRGLFDPDDYTRGRVTAALIQRIAEPWAAALLLDLVGRADVDPYTRGPAALALAQAKDPGAKDALTRALAEIEEPWRRAPLNLALAVLGDAEALNELSAVLKGGDVPMRVDFIIACGAAGLPLAEPLRDGLDRVEEEMVLPLAGALLLLGEPRGALALRAALLDPTIQRRLEAIDTLKLLPEEDAQRLLKRARRGGPPAVRGWATMVLVAQGEAPLSEAVRTLDEEDRELRQQAAWAIGERLRRDGEPERREARQARAALTRVLGDAEISVAIAAARALALCGTPEELPALSAQLNDESISARVELAAAMYSILARAKVGS
ncbi:HEAT repeat domain-containing protein [Myxococcota bacterium]|nr:HEAT repeat domain-containing protein [Myxococcota bacterium]